jgi:iron complex outermembrane receptor protein
MLLDAVQEQLVLSGEINDVGAPLRTSGQSYRLGVELEAVIPVTLN